MKLGSKGNSNPDGLGVWRTDLSWYDEGTIHPITAEVVYAVPHFEVVDVVLDYNKRLIEIPSRMESMVIATALDEYMQVAPDMKRKYESKKKKQTVSDPLFEE